MAVATINNENLCRLLFYHRMVSEDGALGKEAFPTNELIEAQGKSVSVDVMSSLSVPEHIYNKLVTYENPKAGRSKWGYAFANSAEIESVLSQCGKQVFKCTPDPLTSFPPAPWDHAHAKITRASEDMGKGFVRGYRDKLRQLFQQNAIRSP